MTSVDRFYHIGFGRSDLGDDPPTVALLSGDPERARTIAQANLRDVRVLSEHRGLNSYLGRLPSGRMLLSATSGMGAPSLSIVVNELVQVGIRQIIRVGTCGSIQAHVPPGSIVITRAALCRQGAANDIAPPEYPAAADPFLTVALVEAARALQVEHHLGITASVDTFYEGQERSASANSHLLRRLQGITEEYRHLNVLNYEMESGTLFKMAGVYGFAAACVCGVIAQRTSGENIVFDQKANAVEHAIAVALRAAEQSAALRKTREPAWACLTPAPPNGTWAAPRSQFGSGAWVRATLRHARMGAKTPLA
jgi:uridine phosphorylase